MSDWFPPKEHYDKNLAFFENQAREANDSLYAEFQSPENEVKLKGHGFSIRKKATWLEVKRGQLEVIKVIFNFDQSGRCRVINQIGKLLGQVPSEFDFASPAEGVDAFKKQMPDAIDSFYKNRQAFMAQGLLYE